MTRPIFWAMAVSGAAAIWGVGLADRLDRRQSSVAAVLQPAERATPLRTPSAADTTSNALTLHADSRGQFATDVTVDGRHLRMLVDTGASVCAFSLEDAERLGIRVTERDFTSRSQTANGVVAVAPVRVPVIRVGNITVRDVEAVVMPRGRLSTSLLGMSFLRRLGDVRIANGQLTLRG